MSTFGRRGIGRGTTATTTIASMGQAVVDLLSAWRADLTELPQAILERDPAARTRFEVLTLYPGVKAIFGHRLAHALWEREQRYAARAVSEGVRFMTGIEIHPGATIGQRVVIDHGVGVVIGETAVVGDDVTLFQGVTLGATEQRAGKRHPTIGRGTIIGVGASVIGNVMVGEQARIGAGAVVVSDVAEGTSVGGVPASPLRRRGRSEVSSA